MVLNIQSLSLLHSWYNRRPDVDVYSLYYTFTLISICRVSRIASCSSAYDAPDCILYTAETVYAAFSRLLPCVCWAQSQEHGASSDRAVVAALQASLTRDPHQPDG
jgi:hypothetical protein